MPPRKSTKLLAVPPQDVEPRRPKILIYGPPGVKKTWTSLEWPSAYYADTEGGADLAPYREKLRKAGGVYLGPDQGALDFDVVIEQVQLLATEEHPYRTLIIDSASKLWNTALTDEQEQLGSKDAFGAYKKVPTRKWGSLIKWVGRLDMNVIFICHQREIWGLNEKKMREVTGYGPDIQDKLEYELHLVLRIYRQGSTCYAQVGKTRLGGFIEGDRFEWTYDNFAERYGRSVIEKKANPLNLATAEQVFQVTELLERVKMPDNWQDQVFKKANIDDWADLDTDKIEACLKMLRERVSSTQSTATTKEPASGN